MNNDTANGSGTETDVDRNLYEEATRGVLNELFPVVSLFTRQTHASLLSESVKRLLHNDSVERREDPLVQLRYLELARQSQLQLTPGRFPDLHESRGHPTPPAVASGGYVVHSPRDACHPGKGRAPSPTPEQLDRDLDAMGKIAEKYKSLRMERKALRAEKGKGRKYRPENSQILQSPAWSVEHAPISTTGWQGRNVLPSERADIHDLLMSRSPVLMNILAAFTHVSYEGLDQPATRIVDKEGRLFIYRSKLSKWQEDLLPSLAQAIQEFTENTLVSELDRANNKRGPHKFCIAGVDRQSKERPTVCSWHRKGRNSEALVKLFQTPAMRKFNEFASDLVWKHFPGIAKRMEDAQKKLGAKYDLPPNPFGLFFNFCINSPVFEDGIPDVFCVPHTDAQNAAVLVCVVMVYYYGNCETNADERIWLVFWEAGVILQVPAGVFIVYPSALFLHFNVHIEDVLQVTRDGSRPTPENVVPFHESNAENGGRGSIVWFTQASMLISAELPTDTVEQANSFNREAQATGKALIDTRYDATQAIRDGLFPYDASASS